MRRPEVVAPPGPGAAPLPGAFRSAVFHNLVLPAGKPGRFLWKNQQEIVENGSLMGK
jgi:hypothetical protein